MIFIIPKCQKNPNSTRQSWIHKSSDNARPKASIYVEENRNDGTQYASNISNE